MDRRKEKPAGDPDALASPVLAAAVLAWRIPETATVERGDHGPTPFYHRSALAPSLGLFAGIVGMGGVVAFVAIHATENLGLDGASTVLFLFGVIVVATRIVFARVSRRSGSGRSPSPWSTSG